MHFTKEGFKKRQKMFWPHPLLRIESKQGAAKSPVENLDNPTGVLFFGTLLHKRGSSMRMRDAGIGLMHVDIFERGPPSPLDALMRTPLTNHHHISTPTLTPLNNLPKSALSVSFFSQEDMERAQATLNLLHPLLIKE